MKTKSKIVYLGAAFIAMCAFFVVGAGKHAQASATLTFAGSNPLPQTVHVANNTPNGGQTGSWQIAPPTYSYSGNGSWTVSASPTIWPTEPQSSTEVTITISGIAPSTNQYATFRITGDNGFSDTITVNYLDINNNGGNACAITGFSANPASVTSGGSSTLSWSTTNCTSATLNGSGVSVNGSQSTGALTNTTSYTLTATGNGTSTSSGTTVTVGTAGSGCTIAVGATGASGNQYTYSLQGPQNIAGGPGGATFTGLPAGTWTVWLGAHPNSGTFTGYSPSQSQYCGDGESISFAFIFTGGPVQQYPCWIRSHHINANPDTNTYRWGARNDWGGISGYNSVGDTTIYLENGGKHNYWPQYEGGYTFPPANDGYGPLYCGSGGVIDFTFDFSPPTHCVIGNLDADSNSTYVGQPRTLSWSTLNCNAFLKMSGPEFGSGTNVSASGTATIYGQIPQSRYTLQGCDYSNICDTKNFDLTVYHDDYPCDPETEECAYCAITNFNITSLGSNSYRLAWSTSLNCYGVNITYVGDRAGRTGNVTVNPSSTTQYCAIAIPVEYAIADQNDQWCVTATYTPEITGVGDPTNFTADNSNTNPAVPCGQIGLSWTAGGGAVSYNLYRSTDPANKGSVWQTTTATTYMDTTPVVGTTYYYWVQSVGSNSSNVSAAVMSGSVSATSCAINFSTTGKYLTAVNGQAYPYSSNCTTAPAGISRPIKKGDVLTFRIEACNSSPAPANNVTFTDDISGNYLSGFTNVTCVTGCSNPPSYTVNGNVITFNIGTIAPNSKAIVTFDSTLTVPSNVTQTLLRIHNRANINFNNGSNGTDGCVGVKATGSNCTRDTGYIIFYNGALAPQIKEVTP